MTATTARKYNPGFLSDDDLVASFCVRTHEFKSMIEMLRDCTGNSNQHQIVIGPRGSGKTSLLLRVAAEVRRDADLAAGFFPIVFAEESYEVGTAGEFWLECLARLAIQAPEREDAPDLHRTLADLRAIQDDQMLGERCLAALLDFADREGKRLVLMVENLNMMFRDMTDGNAGWRLRKVLQTEPRIVLLASATSRFDEIDQRDHALYDLFRVLTLRPLNTDECALLWETVSGQRRPTKTIRSLEILTGGSPRLLAIVARFGAGFSFRELMDNLFDLVDDHTEYFKSHLESLPAQERRVYLALADLWKPALTKEVAERARIETSKCSAQLSRLIERGVVRLNGGSARRKQYYLSERMYNIYYLLRRGKGRLVDVLIRFMEAYYSPDELQEIGTSAAREVEHVAPEMRALYQYASAELLAMSARVRQLEERRATSRAGAADDAQVVAARALLERGVALWQRHQNEDALAIFNELLERFGEARSPELVEQVANALVNKGVALGVLNRLDEALAACDEVLHRFDDSATPKLPRQVARALVVKSAVLRDLNRLDEALAACDEVLHRFDDSATPELQEQVARALVLKSIVLRDLNRLDEALAAYDEVLHRFDDSATPELLEQVARTLVLKSAVLRDLNRLDEALAACDEVLHRFGDNTTPELLEQVACALVVKSAALGALNRLDEALAACDEVLHRFDDSATPELLEQVARTLVLKSAVLCDLNRLDEGLAACDEVLRRFGSNQAPNFPEHMAGALMVKGGALGALNRLDEALAAYDEVLRRFGASEKTDGHLQQMAHVNKNIILAALGRPTQPQDIVALLAILPKSRSPKGAIRVLMAFAIEHGPERMREWIQASSAAELLKPLTTALEREMGLDPRVPEEVSEVAEDIRRELAIMRKARQAADALGGLQRHAVGRGLNQLTMDEVDQDVQAFRKGRKGG